MADGQLSYSVVFDGIQSAISGLTQLRSTVSSVASSIRSSVQGINNSFASLKTPSGGGGFGAFAQQATQAAQAASAAGAAAGGAGGGMNTLGSAAGSAAGGMGNLHTAASALIGLELGSKLAEWGREAIAFSDEATNAFNRVLATTQNARQATGVFDELVKVSIETRQPLERTAETFQQVEVATNAMGITYRRQIALSKELNQLLIVSGASGQAAKNGISDLLRGLGAGKLSTQEIRGMSRDIPMLAQAITKGLGLGTAAAMQKLVELNKAGKLSAEVVLKALEKVAPEFAAKFGKMIVPVSGGLESLKSGFLGVINSFNQFTGAGSGVGNLLQKMGQHAGVIATVLAGVGAVLVASVIPATVAWGVALLGTGVGELALAVGALSLALGVFEESQFKVAGETASGWQIIRAAIQTAWDYIRPVFSTIGGWLSSIGSGMMGLQGTTTSVFGAIGNIIKGATNLWIAANMASWNVIVALWNNFPGAMNQVFVAVANLAAKAAELVINAWQIAFRQVANLAGTVLPGVAGAINGALDKMTVNLPRAKASASGKAFGQALGDGVRSAFAKDYVGDFGRGVVKHLKTITAEAKKARAAVDDVDGAGSGKPGEEGDGKKKKKGRAAQESDYDKEVRKLKNATYDEGLTPDQLQLADAFDEAGLKRDITITGQLADNIRKLVKNLQEAHRVRQFSDELKKLQEEGYKLTLTDEQQAQLDARKAAGLPTDLKVINEKTKAIDAQAAANFKLAQAKKAADENRNRLDRLGTDLEQDRQKHQDKLSERSSPYESSLNRENEKIQKHYDTYRHILQTLKDMDPAQKALLTGQINQAEQDEKADALYEDRLSQTEKLKGFLNDMWESPRETMKRFFTEFLENILVAIAKATILKSLLGDKSGGGGVGGILKSALSSAFGGGRAVGGSVTAGKYYRVGERGEEWFAPGMSGTIIPNKNLPGGGANINVGATIINIHGNADNNTQQQLAAQAAAQRKTLLRELDARYSRR